MSAAEILLARPNLGVACKLARMDTGVRFTARHQAMIAHCHDDP